MDILIFAGTDTWPAEDGIFRRHAPELVVADHPAQQPVIPRGHPRIFVDGERREDRHIQLEFVGRRDLWRQSRIQAVNAFHDQHVVIGQLQVLSYKLARARGEVIFGDLDPLARKQLLQLLVQGSSMIFLLRQVQRGRCGGFPR